jgi:hypothetical protein
VAGRIGLILIAATILLPAWAGSGESAGAVLQLASGPYRPGVADEAVPAWFEHRAVATSASGRRYPVALTRGPLDAEQRRLLETAGVEILGYIPENGYRLSMLPGVEEAVRAFPFVSWVGRVPAYHKVEPRLSAMADDPSGLVEIRVVLLPGEPPTRVEAVLGDSRAGAHPAGKEGAWRVEAAVPADRVPSILNSVAALPEVEAVESSRTFRLLNQDAVWVHQSFVGPSPQETPVFDRGIFGCDQVVAVADSGQDYDACYFVDTVHGDPPFSSCLTAPCPVASPDLTLRKDVLYYNWSGTTTGDDDTCPATVGGSGHGTHTSGTVAGDAPAYSDCEEFSTPGRTGGDGQAPGAKLIIQELGDGLEYLNTGGGTVWNIADVAYHSGARIHSISWGGVCHDLFGTCIPGCTLPYDSLARDADLAMWTYPDLLMVLAAGNAGQMCTPPNAVSTPGIAKNPVTVGALGHGANAATATAFTSRGPVFDGRLKPTVAAQGEATVSAASDANPNTYNCGTCSLDGSSMSAPTVAGLAALAREYYTDGFYASGVRDEAQGFVPSGALLKATLIDGAVALGPTAGAPDFRSGFGMVRLGSTLAFADSPFTLWVDDHREGVTSGSVVNHAFDVQEGTPLTATLVWTDYPAALNAAVARVNELKLEVIDPQGDVWFQTLDDVTGAPEQTSVATDPHDSLNVEERLIFDTPSAGRWVVRVHGIDVPWGPQPFALVVRGDLAECPAPASPGALTLETPADGQVLLSWAPVPGVAGYSVYRSFGACPGGHWIPVASGLTGTSFLDDTVSGGAAYSYRVVAVSDTDGYCESIPSPCGSVVPTGECVLAPVFRGITGAASAGADRCGVELSWDPALPMCGSDTRYNVYRDTTGGFVPGPANRIARCIGATGFVDETELVSGQAYHYIVRAEDATSGHGGPCRGGNEDDNVAEATAIPVGLPVSGTWLDDAGDNGEAKFTVQPPWTVAASGGPAGSPNVYSASASSGICANLTSPVLTLGDPGTGPQLTFATIHDLEYDPASIFGPEGSIGEVEIAIGPDFSDWTRVELSPDYPVSVEFLFADCTTATPPDTYFTGIDMVYSSYSGSLVNWGGSDVKIRFHLAGDLIYPGGNWWVDDVEVTQALVPGSCSTVAPGPPPVPDGGSVPGDPLRVARSGADLLLTWDATRCPAAAVNLYRGTIGDYTTFTSANCDLPADGSVTVSIPDNTWFVLAATDGAATDGSWSRDPLGNELDYAGAGSVCPAITSHETNNGCP